MTDEGGLTSDDTWCSLYLRRMKMEPLEVRSDRALGVTVT